MMRTDAGWITPPFVAGVDFSGRINSEVRVRFQFDEGATIDSIRGTAEWSCAINGASAECTATSTENGLHATLRVFPRASNKNGAHATLTMTTTHTDPIGGTALSTASLQNYFAVIVNNTNDSGTHSLRAAIERANAEGKPAKLLFQIPPPVPAEGWFTIVPESPLPPITVQSMFVDGKSQTRFTGDTNPRGPEIAIDGRLAHHGLEIHSTCEAKIEGLVLGNFDANQGLWFAQHTPCSTRHPFTIDSERWVADNYIGVDPTGTVAWPNLRGVRADFGGGFVRNNVISGNTYSGMWVWETVDHHFVPGGNRASLNVLDNRFGTAADGVTPLPNGAAGMLFGPYVAARVKGNIIANHPGMGIAIAREGEAFVEVVENSMRDNGGIGIDWGVDGVSAPVVDDANRPPNAPLLLSARYDAAANLTLVAVKTTNNINFSGGDFFNIRVDLYANRTADGDGEQFLPVVPHNLGTEEYAIRGDLRGKWIVATSTRYLPAPPAPATPIGISSEAAHFGDAHTSEFSNAVLVE